MSTVGSSGCAGPARFSEEEPGPMAVFPAEEADFALLSAWVAAGALGPAPPLPALARPLALAGAGVRVGLARRSVGGARLGFVRLDLGPEEAEVSLFVLPGERRTGVARKLLAWAVGQAAGRRLYALVKPGNLPAEAFFGALSFRVAGPGPDTWVRWVLGSNGPDERSAPA